MISTETINTKIQMLPAASQREVLDFIDDLLQKTARSDKQQTASAWEDWAQSHADNNVVVDDSREAIGQQ